MIESPTQPATIDENGKPPVNRFTTFSGLHSSYEEARRRHTKEDYRFTALRGIFDGHPPEDPAFLSENGMEDMPNFNTREFTAKVKSYVSTWTDHNCGGYKYAEVKAKQTDPQETPEAVRYYSEKLTEFFNEAITEWDDEEEIQSAAEFILEGCVRDLQMGIFGIGPIYWPDDIDWRWVPVPTRKVLMPSGTKISLRNCPAFHIETETTVTALYKKVVGDDYDKDWDKEAVLELLYQKTSEMKGSQRESLAEWQNRLRNNDDFVCGDFQPVELVDSYVQEFKVTGKKDGISHYVMARSGTPCKFLYKKDRKYGSFRTIMVPFCDSAGPEGDWHGVKGFGDEIYDSCDFQNRFFNHIARASMVNSMPMFQAGSETDREKFSQMKWSNMGVLNPGLQISQINVKADINGAMAVLQESKRTTNTNTRIFPQGEKMGGDAKTATQSVFDRQDQAQFNGLQIKFYRMVCLDRMFAEMYRRLTADNYPENLPGGRAAKNFRDRCKEAGVPKKCYQSPKMVIADRTGGTGNQALDAQRAQQLLNVATPGRGQLNARKDVARAHLSDASQVGMYVEDAPIADDQDRLISYENGFINDGQVLEAFPNEDHQRHLGEPTPEGRGHLAVLVTAQQVAAQMSKSGAVADNLEDAKKLSRVLEAALSHCAQHMQFLATLPMFQELAKQLAKTLNDAGQFLQTFNEEVGRALEAQQPQGPQMTPEHIKAMIDAQVKAQIKMQDADLDRQLRAQDAVDKANNTLLKTQAKEEARNIEFNQNLGRKAQEAAIDFERKRTETQMDMAASAEESASTRAKNNAKKAD